MAKPKFIELADEVRIPILYEDRSIIAIDKPSGWMLIPNSWDKTDRNLQLAIQSSIQAGDYWARSRQLRSLRYIHRLDAETTGVMLFGKSPGAVNTYSQLFADRCVEKIYLAVVATIPSKKDWICREKLSAEPNAQGRRFVDPQYGKEAETHFRVVQTQPPFALIEARPTTGRTHQIRLHLLASGLTILHDPLYALGNEMPARPRGELALRAVSLSYQDPFQRRRIRIMAPTDDFLSRYGFRSAPDKQPPS
ncbi:MAG: RluA family pseudouridine synthase [Verrucomicrobia bacterium]|nr:RluA family pseudouridine synthase [Verrucomicrobiota bacterium]